SECSARKMRLTFASHKDYFVPGLPYAYGVEVTVDEDPSSRLASWIAGKYDFAPEYGQCVRRLALQVAQQRRPGLKTQDFVVLFGAYNAMKVDREPFREVRVRRALGIADDWKQILGTNAWALGQ